MKVVTKLDNNSIDNNLIFQRKGGKLIINSKNTSHVQVNANIIMNTYSEFLEKRILEILRAKAYNIYIDNTDTIGSLEQTKEAFASMYNFKEMSLKEKQNLYDLLIGDNISKNIETIKFWVKFWSILYLIAAGIGLFSLFVKY